MQNFVILYRIFQIQRREASIKNNFSTQKNKADWPAEYFQLSLRESVCVREGRAIGSSYIIFGLSTQKNKADWPAGSFQLSLGERAIGSS